MLKEEEERKRQEKLQQDEQRRQEEEIRRKEVERQRQEQQKLREEEARLAAEEERLRRVREAEQTKQPELEEQNSHLAQEQELHRAELRRREEQQREEEQNRVAVQQNARPASRQRRYVHDTGASNVEITNAWEDVLSHSANKWLLLSFEGASNTLEISGKGDGGFNEMKASLDPSKVMFGALKIFAVDDRGSGAVSRREKLVGITYLGEKVSILKKARASVQKEQVSKILRGIQVTFDFDDPDEFTQEALTQKLMACGGAHKPGYYEFGPNDRFDLNFYVGGDR